MTKNGKEMKKKQNSATETTQRGRTGRKQRQNKRSKTRMVPSVKIRTRESYMRLSRAVQES